jgi:DNA-directed RNA polymerase specialized sigma24 family protein
MGRLAEFDRQLLGRIFLQEHSHDQAACLLHCSRSTLERRLPEALDLLSEEFLRVGLLTGVPSRREFSE